MMTIVSSAIIAGSAIVGAAMRSASSVATVEAATLASARITRLAPSHSSGFASRRSSSARAPLAGGRAVA